MFFRWTAVQGGDGGVVCGGWFPCFQQREDSSMGDQSCGSRQHGSGEFEREVVVELDSFFQKFECSVMFEEAVMRGCNNREWRFRNSSMMGAMA